MRNLAQKSKHMQQVFSCFGTRRYRCHYDEIDDLARFERHHNVDKYKMVSEQTMPPTNVNQMSTTALEDNMAFAYQQQNGNRTDEESPEQTSLLSVPEEETTDVVEEVSLDLPPKEYDQRKASTTSGMSTSSLSELIGRFFHKGGRLKSERNPTLPDPNLPGTSGESYKDRIKEARELRKQNVNGKQNRRRSSLANYRSWWSYLRTRLPEIAALNNEQNQKQSEKMTMKQMYERRTSLFSHDKSKSKNEFFRRFSLNTPSTEKERHEVASTSSTMNIHQIVGSFKERFHSHDNPLHSRAKQRERQRKRKCREHNKRKMYTNNSQVTRSRSPSFTVPQKSSKHSHKSKKRNPAFASIDQEAAYVSLITRRRTLEQMRRRYMHDVAMRKETGGFDSDPQIPADVEL
ncbi:peptidyl-prolyl cis-trans isomerase 1-like [Octopus bimaculoides]|uniref:peptidyl-prolyl cis-trans isomerase 1-like n=1 Tax=Octopus bimaculoides TaxID=37653 RepID=UPI0022E2E5BE|nr:peptidyl-prolyl cis-trans isomerase 1-like [Octopus bimaculoides]